MKLTRTLAAILTAVILAAMPVNAAGDDIRINEDFTDAETIGSNFNYGGWHLHPNGGIYGYADAKVLTSLYDDSVWPFDAYKRHSWLTYDATVTLASADDTDSEDDRWVNLVYANDNLMHEGIANRRLMMSFSYDFGEGCFRFAEHWSTDAKEAQILPPVYMDICDDGTEFYTLGISVEKDHIRCFYNGQLIFDYEDTEQKYLIAHFVESQFILWQTGNYIHVKNVTIAKPGWLFGDADTVQGDADGNGKMNLSDVALILKYISEWDVDIVGALADVSGDGKVNLADAAMILRVLAAGDEIRINEDFTDMRVIRKSFVCDDWCLHENGGIYGYADTKAIQTLFDDSIEIMDWEDVLAWLTYDAMVTLAASDDADSEDDRWVNLVYVNENLMYEGLADSRVMMSFSYDFQNRCFRFTEGWCTDAKGAQIMPPVYMDICDDGTEFYTLGISVEKDRIRCFYNGQLIFDYEDAEQKYLVAKYIHVPFLLWQTGNYIHVKNVTIAKPGWLFGDADTVQGDADGNGKMNLSDVALILKYAAEWDVDIVGTLADVSGDGKVNLTDAAMILRVLAG